MGDLKRSKAEYDQEIIREPKRATASLKTRYSQHARNIVRYAILTQGSGRPLRRKELAESLEISTKQVDTHIVEARSFMKQYMKLDLVSLKSCLPPDDKSAARDEYVVISRASNHRRTLLQVYPSHDRQDYGIMLLIVIMAVLKEDALTLEEIFDGYSHIHPRLLEEARDVEDDEGGENTEDSETTKEAREQLKQAISRLESKRAIRSEIIVDPASADKVEVYHIGPYSRAILKARSLSTLIMKLTFPGEASNTSLERQEKYKTLMATVHEKVLASNFKEAI